MDMLPDAETFKRLVDGSSRGLGPSSARLALAVASLPYAAAVTIRNGAYDLGLASIHAVDAPVIAVGNLTLGGTGKTPLVAWVARLLAAGGRHPAVVSRGYKATPGEMSDEALELCCLVPGLQHVANRDRVAGSVAAIARGADAIVLDDGFQHRRLRRDLDIVAVDATDPYGSGHLFPRGLLREPLGGIARADAVVLTRASAIPADRRDAIRRTLLAARGQRPFAAWMEAEHRPTGLRRASGSVRPLDDLAGRRVVAFAGIGNPAAFRTTLTSLGATIAAFVSYPDHHAYSPADREHLEHLAQRESADVAVTTLKDLVKLDSDSLGAVPLAAVEIAMAPLCGGDELAALVAATVSRHDRSRQA